MCAWRSESPFATTIRLMSQLATAFVPSLPDSTRTPRAVADRHSDDAATIVSRTLQLESISHVARIPAASGPVLDQRIDAVRDSCRPWKPSLPFSTPNSDVSQDSGWGAW